MKHSLLSGPPARRSFWSLMALLASASAAQAQTPSVIYGLGTITKEYSPSIFLPGVKYSAGTQALAMFDPQADGTATPITTVQAAAIVGITPGQKLVGIDARPSTGVLYALGLDAGKTTANAQLYTLAITTPSTLGSIGTATLTAVGAALTLDIKDTESRNTSGLLPNVGFDFNPRVDRIRVVAPNGTNYRLNPNTGAVTTDSPLNYATGGSVASPAHAPYVGTAAYTNAQVGLTGTTLYDIDITAGNGLLSIQSPPNQGQLNPVAPVTFYLPNSTSPGPYPLTSPVIGLGLDIYTEGSTNSAYLVETRYRNSPSTADNYTSNLYSFNLTTGRATQLYNIAGGVPIFFSDIAVALPAPITWTGAAGTAWGVGGNWSTGQVPPPTSNVYIPGPSASVPNQPVVSDAQAINSVVLGSGAVLTTADGGTLSVSGNFVNNDGQVAGSGSGTVALVGTGAHEIAGGATSQFRNLSVGSGGATTSAPVLIEQGLTLAGNLTLGAGTTAGTFQPLTLLSSATTGTAFVVNNGGSVTQPVTVQRYIDGSLNGGLGYRHFSSPLTDATLGTLATGSYTPIFNPDYNASTAPGTTVPFPTVYGYDQAHYENSPATTITTDFDRGFYSPSGTDAWTPGIGYTVNIPGTETITFRGTLQNSDFTTAAQGRSSKANAGWQLLGNPYPSALDWDVVAGRQAPAGGTAASGLNGLNDAVYVFKSSSRLAGTYASYVNGVGANGGTRVIPLGQGFFVRTAAGSSAGSLSFRNGQRIAGSTSTTLQRTAADSRPLLRLELGTSTSAAQTAVYFENGATPAFDKAYDAEALPFLNGLLLATTAGSSLLSINGLPTLAGTATVPLRVGVAKAGTYTLSALDLNNLPTNYHAYLHDALLGTYTDLAATPSVTLNLAAGSAAERFAVVFATATPLAAAAPALAALVAVYPNPAHGTAVLLLPAALRGTAASEVQVLNALGQQVLHRTVAAGGADQVVLPLTGLAAGLYTVRATTASGTVAKQLQVE